jgi:hypothetical protein
MSSGGRDDGDGGDGGDGKDDQKVTEAGGESWVVSQQQCSDAEMDGRGADSAAHDGGPADALPPSSTCSNVEASSTADSDELLRSPWDHAAATLGGAGLFDSPVAPPPTNNGLLSGRFVGRSSAPAPEPEPEPELEPATSTTAVGILGSLAARLIPGGGGGGRPTRAPPQDGAAQQLGVRVRGESARDMFLPVASTCDGSSPEVVDPDGNGGGGGDDAETQPIESGQRLQYLQRLYANQFTAAVVLVDDAGVAAYPTAPPSDELRSRDVYHHPRHIPLITSLPTRS